MPETYYFNIYDFSQRWCLISNPHHYHLVAHYSRREADRGQNTRARRLYIIRVTLKPSAIAQ